MQILKETIINAETKNPNLFTNIILDDLLSNTNLPLRAIRTSTPLSDRVGRLVSGVEPPTALSPTVNKLHPQFIDTGSIAIARKKKYILHSRIEY